MDSHERFDLHNLGRVILRALEFSDSNLDQDEGITFFFGRVATMVLTILQERNIQTEAFEKTGLEYLNSIRELDPTNHTGPD